MTWFLDDLREAMAKPTAKLAQATAAEPAQSPAPAPKARAKVEVKSPKLNLSDEKQAQLKAIQDKLRANLSKNNGTLSMNPLKLPPVLDPENVSLAAQMAALYAEGGVKTFKQFAHNVSVDMADAWDAIKQLLSGAWRTAGELDDSLDDPTRGEAREVISAIDKAAAEADNTLGSEEVGDEQNATGDRLAAQDGEAGTDPVGDAGTSKGGSRRPTGATVQYLELGLGEGGRDSGLPAGSVGVAGQRPAGSRGTGVPGNRTDGVVPKSTGRDRAPVAESAAGTPESGRGAGSVNYSLAGKAPVMLTKGERRTINEQAKALLSRGGPFTDAEQNILRQYTGEGGLSSGSEEALTQHYTSYDVIRSMFDALTAAGLKPKKALEPSVGSGNFVGMRPNLDWTTVDIDPTNHEIVKALYPQARHYLNSFEDFRSSGFDLIISNVPFLEQRTRSGKKTRPDINTLHDFYFAHSLSLVADGGVVAFVTSRGSMDKKGDAVRRELMEQGDLLGAFRLPSSAFEKNAHTSVITDIIFIQKRPAGVMPSAEQKAINDSFIEATETKDGIVLNNYYHTRMENMLGEVTVGKDKARFGNETYQIAGEPDLARISIRLNQYAPSQKATTATPATTADANAIPTDSVDFRKWAAENDVMIRESAVKVTGPDGQVIEISRRDSDMDRNLLYDQKTGRFFGFSAAVEFKDVRGTAKVYRPVSESASRKLAQLQEIADAGRAFQQTGDEYQRLNGLKMIEGYRETFEVHPSKDMKLRRLVKELGEQSLLAEMGSYFNTKFEPSSVFVEKVRYEGSGKAQVSATDPLAVRAFASEDNTGSINLADAEHVSADDLPGLLSAGYSVYSYADGTATVQNDILYYAGNIYAKLKQARAALQNAAGDETVTEKLQQQIEALEELKPQRLALHEIRFKGVEPWILPILRKYGIFDPYQQTSQKTGERSWKSGHDAYDKFLNNQQLVSRMQDESESMFLRRVKDAEEAVQRRLDQIRERIAANPEAESAVVEAYNASYRNYIKPDYQKAEYLIRDVLDEIRENTKGRVTLRKNQIEWVIQALYEGKGINAHDVGGGKTMAAITLARAMKLRGMAHKPMFVVPAKTIKKWQKETLMLFPKADVLNLGNLGKDKRTEALFALANRNADYVFISTEGFEKIKLPAEAEARYIRAVANENMSDPEATGRAAALMNQKIADFIRIAAERPRDTRLTFDKLGIDMIIADEAHAYKNIGIASSLNKWGLGTNFGMNMTDRTPPIKVNPNTEKYSFTHPVTKRQRTFDSEQEAQQAARAAMAEAGIEAESASLQSARSYDFRFKANFINENNNGRNVFLLTATPTPNKPLEVYSMLRHLSADIFHEYGIYSAKDFVDTFFKLGTVNDPAKNKSVNVLRAIINAQSLRSILNRFVDKVAMEDMPHIKVPSEKGNKHFLEQSDAWQAVAEELHTRSQNAPKGRDRSPGDDSIISIYSAGRNASVDPRLYGDTHATINVDTRSFDETDDKIEYVIQTAGNNLKANPAGGQLIFLDNAGHTYAKTGKLAENIHREIKTQLMEQFGLKANQIAIINGQELTNPDTGADSNVSGDKKDQRKYDIAEAYNAGKIKVVIGTTASMGEGMDLQVKTTDIWHVDIPHKPGDYRQRNGRGVRYGNENDEVNVHYMFMRGTYDSLSFANVINKRGWNEAIWDKEVADEISVEEEMVGGGVPERDAILIEMERDPTRKAELIVDLHRRRLATQEADIQDNIYSLNRRQYATEAALHDSEAQLAERQQKLKDLVPNPEIKDEAKRQAQFDKSRTHLQKLIESTQRRMEAAQAETKRIADVVSEATEERQKVRDQQTQLRERFENSTGKLIIPADFIGRRDVAAYLRGEGEKSIEESIMAARSATPTAAGIARTEFDSTMQAEAAKTPWHSQNASAVESLDALPAPVRQAIARGEGQAAMVGISAEIVGDASPAAQMEQDGATRGDIWKKTGWWRGLDGKWRFEVNDRQMKLKNIGTASTLAEAVEYPALFEAYPELRNVRIKAFDVDPAETEQGLFVPDENSLMAIAPTERGLRSVMLHEMQHWIQQREGMAQGGDNNAESLAPDVANERRELNRTLTQMAKSGQYGTDEFKRLEARRNKLIDMEWEYDNPANAEKTFDAYRLLHGEAEARLTQRRIAMSDLKRQIEPPWVTLDKMLADEGLLKEGQTAADVLSVRFMRDGAGHVRAVTMGDKSWFILDRYNDAAELSGDIREEAFHRIENEYADPARTRRLGVATYGGKWQAIAREIEKNYGFKPGSVESPRSAGSGGPQA